MSCIVDQMFPARLEDTSEDYTSFVFWREPLVEVVVDLESTFSLNPGSSASPPKSGSSTENMNKKGSKK